MADSNRFQAVGHVGENQELVYMLVNRLGPNKFSCYGNHIDLISWPHCGLRGPFGTISVMSELFIEFLRKCLVL